jgi:hypothetical protein
MMEKCVGICLFASVQGESIRSGRRPARQLTGLQYLPHTLARQIYEAAGLQFTHPDAYRKVSASRSKKATGHRRHDFRQTRDGHGNVPAAGEFIAGGIKTLAARAG